MAIQEKTVWVGLYGSNSSYYENLDYEIPRRIDKKGRLTIPNGSKIEVSIDDLPEYSNAYVHKICDYCGNTKKEKYCVISKGRKSYGIDTCNKCKGKKIAETQRFTFEEVESYFESQGCLLLETEYISAKIPLKYICSCGEKSESSYDCFKNRDHRCKMCGISKMMNSQKLPYKLVKEYYETYGCTLLDDNYENYNTLMSYICACGNQHSSTFGNFKQTLQCNECGINSRSGENHYKWVGGVTKLRMHLRQSISNWKNDSLRHYDYRCIITNRNEKDLEIHHSYPFYKIVRQAIEQSNLRVHDNIGDYSENELKLIENIFFETHNNYGFGFPLIKELHKEFHLIYGYIDFTPDDFEEFKQNKISELFTQIA